MTEEGEHSEAESDAETYRAGAHVASAKPGRDYRRYPGMLEQLAFERVAELGADLVDRYIGEEIDAAYLVFNEFNR